MLIFVLYSLCIAITFYSVCFRMRMKPRIIVSISLFFVLVITMVIIVAMVGDNAPPGSVTYDSNGKIVPTSPSR